MKVGTDFGGRILTPDDHGFQQACGMYNGAIAESPRAIYYCTSEKDVQVVVRAAVDCGTQVVVRSTGHSVSGRSIATDAVVIDLSGMRSVKRLGGTIIAADGGATWRDFDTTSAIHGLAVTGGTVSTTGVAGLTLGGGIGWLLPSAGLACDSLHAVRLVTADGSVVDVSDETDPELMRCLRGLGHGIGVATQLEFEASPLRPLVAGSISLDAARLSDRKIDEICGAFLRPAEAVMLSPALIYRDERAVLSIDLALHGPSRADIRMVELLAAGPDVIHNTVRHRDYVSLQTMLDNPSRAGLRARWRPNYLRTVDPIFLRTLVDLFLEAPSIHSIVFLEHYHGVFTSPARASEFPGRGARYAVLVTASWKKESEDARNHEWLNEITRLISPWAVDYLPYLNYLSQFTPGARGQWPAAYTNVRRRLDPGALFADALPPTTAMTAGQA